MRIIDADQYAVEMKARQDAVKASIDHPIADRYYTDKEHWEGVLLAFAEAKLTLDKQPAIDAALVKHGRWIMMDGMKPPEYHHHHQCSVCESYAPMKPPYGGREEFPPFCPACGARMGGVENEHGEQTVQV